MAGSLRPSNRKLKGTGTKCKYASFTSSPGEEQQQRQPFCPHPWPFPLGWPVVIGKNNWARPPCGTGAFRWEEAGDTHGRRLLRQKSARLPAVCRRPLRLPFPRIARGWPPHTIRRLSPFAYTFTHVCVAFAICLRNLFIHVPSFAIPFQHGICIVFGMMMS